jgi:uncharacterized protein (DUF362 family)
VNRRKFIKFNTTALALSCLPLNNIFAESVKPTVWEVSGTSVDSFTALFDALGGLNKFIKTDLSKAVILIKPNICLPHLYESATTTSVNAVSGLCQYLIGAGAKKIIIADHTLQDSTRFKNIQLYEIPKQYSEVKLILANERRYYRQAQVNGKELKETEIMKLVQKADFLINMPTAKHHSATHVSLAVKNLMGMIWDRPVFHTTLDLHQAVGDLPLAICPQLNIVDADRVLLNGGPTGPGKVIHEKRLFASSDMLAVDAVVASRYNFGGKSLPPEQIGHLDAAFKNNVGEIDLNKINNEKIAF